MALSLLTPLAQLLVSLCCLAHPKPSRVHHQSISTLGGACGARTAIQCCTLRPHRFPHHPTLENLDAETVAILCRHKTDSVCNEKSQSRPEPKLTTAFQVITPVCIVMHVHFQLGFLSASRQ